MKTSRRNFLKKTGLALAGSSIVSTLPFLNTACEKGLFYDISLAQWSLNNTLFSGEMTNLDFPVAAKEKFGIHAVEYVNRFFESTKTEYLAELLKRTKDYDVKNLLIMVDGEGGLAQLNNKDRQLAVENHYKWVEAAKYLGCHSIRVNAYGEGSKEEVMDAAVKGLGALTEFAEQEKINVIVENHGGYSSNGEWLSTVIRKVANSYCGTLPDFGNFCIERKTTETGERICIEDYDRYKGMKELMPFAKGVSAKSHAFNEDGEETTINYFKMMEIVKNAGYRGYVGIEYEGKELSEEEGILATKNLLIKVGTQV